MAGLLNSLPTIEYRRHVHTALLTMLVAQFGGSRNGLDGFLFPFANPGAGDSRVRLTLKGAQAEAFRLGLQHGLISQRLLNLFSVG